jgi:hypothetical protein
MKHYLSASPMKAATILILLSMLLLFPACGKKNAAPDKYSMYEGVVDDSKPIAWGENTDIYIFCDEVNWKPMQERLKSNLEREFMIVSKEHYFNIIKGDINKLDEQTKYKNLLFIGDVSSNTAVSKHIRNSMPAGMSEKVNKSGGEILVATNRWVKDQLVIYLVGANQQKLIELNDVQANRLFNLFLSRYAERLAYQTYQTKLIPEDFFLPYPYTLKLPGNYRLFNNDEKNHFLSFIYRMKSESRDFPDKYMSVYYEDMPENKVNLEWLLNKRKELAYKYYDQDVFEPKQLFQENVVIDNHQAIKVIGPWKNLKHFIGGGFQSYAFYDAKQKRAYLIDNAVYFPAGDKLPELLEMQKITETFKTK